MTKPFSLILHPIGGIKRQDSGKDWRRYIMLIPIEDLLAALVAWVEGVNPRSYNRNSRAAKAIWKTLTEQPAKFEVLNRGLILSAAKCTDGEEAVEVLFSDPEMHGICDGNHTFQTIRRYIDEVAEEDRDGALVQIQVFTGLQKRADVEELVASVNNNERVKQVSLMNNSGAFEAIRLALKAAPYAGDISYEENGPGSIGIEDIVGVLVAMDAEGWAGGEHPICTYNSSAKVLSWYADHKKTCDKNLPRLQDLLALRDDIEGWIGGLMAGRHEQTLKELGIRRLPRRQKLAVSGQEVGYTIPRAYIMPVLAALRGLASPAAAFDKAKRRIERELIDGIEAVGSPTKYGRLHQTWSGLHGAVRY